MSVLADAVKPGVCLIQSARGDDINRIKQIDNACRDLVGLGVVGIEDQTEVSVDESFMEFAM